MKRIASFLVLFQLLCCFLPTTVLLATSEGNKVENQLGLRGIGSEPNNNRYYYKTVEGSYKVVSSKNFSANDIAKADIRKTFVNSIISLGYEPVAVILSNYLQEIQGIERASKVVVENKIDKRIKVDRLTGKETLVSTTKTARISCYLSGQSSPYKVTTSRWI